PAVAPRPGGRATANRGLARRSGDAGETAPCSHLPGAGRHRGPVGLEGPARWGIDVMADSKQPTKAAARRAPTAARRAPAAEGADGRGRERLKKAALRPDLQPLTKSQALRLASLTDVDAES